MSFSEFQGKQVAKAHSKGGQRKPPTTSSSKRSRTADFDATRFLSLACQKRFESWYGPKTIIPEKAVDLDSLPEDSPIKEVIRMRKWEKLVTFAENSSSEILKEFLANVNREDVDTTRSSWVRGVEVPFAPEAIEEFLHTSFLPTDDCRFLDLFDRMQPVDKKNTYQEEMPELADTIRRGITCLYSKWQPKASLPYVPEKLKRNHLTGEAAFWHNFNNGTVIPSTNLSDVNVERAVLLYVLMRDNPLDISRVLSDRILKIIQDGNPKNKLAHSSLIMHLCAQAGVPSLPEEDRDVKVDTTPMHFKQYQNLVQYAADEQLVRASKLTDEQLAARSPRRAPRASHEEPRPATPIRARASSSSTARVPRHDLVYEDSHSYLQMQSQLDRLVIQSDRRDIEGGYHTRMFEDICRNMSIDYMAYQPQYPPVPPTYQPPMPYYPPSPPPEDQHDTMDAE